MVRPIRVAPCLVVLVVLAVLPKAAASQSRPSLDGMWSDPPNTLEDSLCVAWCSDAGLDRLNALLDDPANDSRPFGQLRAEADAFQRDVYLKPRLTAAIAKTFPLDPATDPSFLLCEPYGLLRQAFARHQLEIKHVGDHIEMRYGEWAARRVVYMDGRPLPKDERPSRLGYSVGRYDGSALVIESTAIAPGRFTGGIFQHSDRLHLVERYMRSDDGKRLLLTATLTDPLTFREPLVLKKVWRWAPESEITPDVQCERPTEVRSQQGR